MELPDDVYCIECGEDEDIAYLQQTADSEIWKCRVCEREFQTKQHTMD